MKKIKTVAVVLSTAVMMSGCAYMTYEITTAETTAETTAAETTTEASEEETSEETTAEETTVETTETTEATTEETTEEATVTESAKIDIDGSYTTMEDVSLYLYTYGELPSNFITKKEAKELGWEGGSLEPYAPGKCIGGDYFGNYEELLPKEDGREYHECDIDTLGAKSRGAKRIIYSNDGLIYYTADHYESFELLYGEE